MKENNITFWKLIKDHKIEIPIIQRDYAQGRDNIKSEDIRVNFICQIKNSLTRNSIGLHLNFIYGKIDGLNDEKKRTENEAAVIAMMEAVKSYSKNVDIEISTEVIKQPENNSHNTSTTFIPLDGQQRLTTLYLVHWFLMPFNDENVSVLKNFTYLIRSSSIDFCQALAENHNKVDKTNPISEQIENSEWFFSYWKNDPTVKGMLTMLDEIFRQFRNEEVLDEYWYYLTKENKIYFEFLNLEDYDLTDQLYVKMNARGKSLTAFENFKAWLIERIDFRESLNSNRIIEVEDWKLLLDTLWADLFWFNKDKENMLIDEEYMRYFRNMAQIYAVENSIFDLDGKSDESKSLRDTVVSLTEKGEDGEYKFVPINYFEKIEIYNLHKTRKVYSLKIFTDEKLNEVLKIIQAFSKKGYKLGFTEKVFSDNNLTLGYSKEKDTVFRSFISGTMTYPDKVRFYALSLFLINSSNSDLDEKKLVSWMRVCRNLIENNTIDDITTFSRAIRGIKQLSEYCFEIISYLSNDGRISGFRREQISEERVKANLIIEDSRWEDELQDAENHNVFQGKIDFLLEDGLGLKEFTIRKNIAKEIFYKKYRENFLVTRAVLAQSEINENIYLKYTVTHWRELLDKSKVKESVNKVISYLQKYNGTIEEGLKSIISNYDNKEYLWRYNLVKNAKLLNSAESQSKKIQWYAGEMFLYNKETWNNNDKQFLLSNYRNDLIEKLIEKDSQWQIDDEIWDGYYIVDDFTKQTFYRGFRIYYKKNVGEFRIQIEEDEFEIGDAVVTLEFEPQRINFGFRYNHNKVKELENYSKENNGWICKRQIVDEELYNSDIEVNISKIISAINTDFISKKSVLSK